VIDQERGGSVHEGPQLERNLLRVATHTVTLAVEGNLIDEIAETLMPRAEYVLRFLECWRSPKSTRLMLMGRDSHESD
jgi:hypothetical protein